MKKPNMVEEYSKSNDVFKIKKLGSRNEKKKNHYN